MNINQYQKGSTWRKWDLHLHSPYTFLNNQFNNCDQNEYIQTIVASELKVIGYTNYFKFDTKDLDVINSLKSKGVTVFPNLEFRIDQKNKDNECIHLHIIFSDLTAWTHIQSFLGRLKTIDNKFCTDLSLQEINDTVLSLDTIKKTLHDEPNLNLYDDYVLAASPRGQGSFRPGKNDGRGNTVAEAIDHSVQIIFGTRDDTTFFLDKNAKRTSFLAKPVFYCSDAHDLSAIGSNPTWIKGDPTFLGLKQCIYEPELRVKIQDGNPENKTGYQVIDKIELNSEDVGNTTLELNPYLNTIIGGRSTGKSILLRAIAAKLQTRTTIPEGDYTKYAKEISSKLNIIWKDGREDDSREIEYFSQGFIQNYSRDASGTDLTKVIRDILDKKGKKEIFQKLDLKMQKISSNISQLIDEYFKIEALLLETQKQALANGDKQGIEKEIEKLTKLIKDNTPNTLTESERSEYEETSASIKKANTNISQFKLDLIEINKIKDFNFIENSIDGELLECSDSLKQNIKAKYEKVRSEAKEKWLLQINELQKSEELKIYTEEKNIATLNINKNYIKGIKILTDNTQLTKLKQDWDLQVSKLEKINKLIENKDKLNQRKEELLSEIKDEHALFFSHAESCIPDLTQSSDNLEILPLTHFDELHYINMLKVRINLQSFENQEIVNFIYQNYELFKDHIFNILTRLLNNTITLKAGVDSQEFSKTLLSHCFYSIKFDLVYENDDFKKMSEGKKAFVVLKLLLDFSDKECPILIDQPEDDMDNRDIYTNLVKYIREKKEKRQIILTTHNPNIAVGSDSELIIVANQHGSNRKNKSEKKFDYLTGSLEQSHTSIELYTLESQGIREHVCEILEGGNEAFKKREKKYGF